tara:strand:- start:153 stop:293 length:141 start_codon:yes stop_codon:yes gene_type:complete
MNKVMKRIGMIKKYLLFKKNITEKAKYKNISTEIDHAGPLNAYLSA